MAQIDNFFNRLMPKLPTTKNTEEQKARDLSNQRVLQQLQNNPRSFTYLGLTGVGNDRKFTNPVAPIAKAYNDTGGGLAGVGGVLGAAGKTVANDASQLVETLAQPFVDANQRVTNQFVAAYDASKSALPAASQAASDVIKGVSSGYTGTPVNERTNMETAWASVDGKNAQRLTPAQPSATATLSVPASSPNTIGVSDFGLAANPKPPVEPGNNELTWDAPPTFTGQPPPQPPHAPLPSEALAKAMAANPASTGRQLIDVAAGGGQPYAPIFAGQSKQVGVSSAGGDAPFKPSQGGRTPMPANNPSEPMYRPLMEGGVATNVQRGGSPVPIYETNYYGQEGQPIATIAGKNQRVGGGTLSVLSGRTPEEQAAIDARVKSIDSQTAAMRGLRNANRLSQGGVTVEQEEQMNAMRQMMGQLAPSPSLPNTGRLDEQQAALMGQLKDAQNIKGWGKRRQREDAMEAAKIGLAQIEAQRQTEGQQYSQQYGQQLGLAQNLIQNQTAQDSARAKAMQDQQQWLADYGLRQQANEIAGQKNEVDAANTGQQRLIDQQRLALDQTKAQREGLEGRPDQKYMAQFYRTNESDPANPIQEFLPERFTSSTGIPLLPEKDPDEGQVYLNPKEKKGVIFGPNGTRLDLGLEDAIMFDRLLKQRRGLLP